MSAVKIAVLITCHNRRETTLTCLESLYQQQLPWNISFEVYLVDDGSKDGTAQAVKEKYPNVKLIEGDGSLYWCGGMRLAWEAAAARCIFNQYLWLNDDVLLNVNAINELILTAEALQGIVIGSCCDPCTSAWTYGGRRSVSGKKSLKGIPVLPNGKAQPCQIINGNVVMVPAIVYERIGGLDYKYTHAIGDVDYGFRALDVGIPIAVAPNYLALCVANSSLADWCNPDIPLRKRLISLNSPKGIHFHEFMNFCITHVGLTTILVGIKIIVRTIFPSLWLLKKTAK